MKIAEIKKPGFEKILSCDDGPSGLKAIIAVDNTHLGPALGGIRMYPYGSEKDALYDVTRLARAMTFKNAAARLKLGGGKAVIIGNPDSDKSPAKFKAMAEFINQFEGSYLSAKDAGIVTEDLVEIAKHTKFVTGLPESMGGAGDPSPWTTHSILECMRIAICERLGKNSFEGIRVAIQGTGHVGAGLARLLASEGAHLILSDVNSTVCEALASELDVEVLPVDEILSAYCVVLAPCAMGSAITKDNIDKLQCSIICGGANNQLEEPEALRPLLAEKNILYVPDYIANAGGVINIYARDILKEKDSMPRIHASAKYLSEILSLAKAQKKPPADIADGLTKKILEN